MHNNKKFIQHVGGKIAKINVLLQTNLTYSRKLIKSYYYAIENRILELKILN